MSRAVVRFQPDVLRSPDEIWSPHHDKAPDPKGILVKVGGTKNGKASISRRDRRYSMPVETVAKMQNMSLVEPYHRHDYSSRQRSISGGLLDSSHHHHRDRDHRDRYDSSHYPRTPHAPSSRRNSLQPGSRPVLPPHTQPFAISAKHPHNAHVTSNHRDSTRRHSEGYGFPVAYGYPGSAHREGVTPATLGHPGGTPYHLPVESLPAGFIHGTATTRSSTYYSPSPQSDARRQLPDRDRERARSHSRDKEREQAKLQPSMDKVEVARSLRSPRVVWNVAFPFSSAILDSHSRLSVADLDEHASRPAIDKFLIKFEDSKSQQLIRSFYRSMRVAGSKPITYEGSVVGVVTIRDVLNAIFDFFQTPITREEYSRLSNEEAQMVLRAQRKRMGRHAYGFGDPLRADLLGSYTRFEGVYLISFKDRRISFGLDLSRW